MQRRSFMALAGSCLVCGCAVRSISCPRSATATSPWRRRKCAWRLPPQRRSVSDDGGGDDPAHGDPARQGAGHESLPRDECRRVRLEVPDVARQGPERRRHGIWQHRAQPRHRRICRQRGRGLPGGGPRDRPSRRQPRRPRHAQPDDRRPDRRRSGGRSPALLTGSSPGADATRSAAQLGARIGHLSFSKEQEREADYMAALILYRPASISTRRAACW